MQRGRKPGYKHDKETKSKISQTLVGSVKDDDHKDKISHSMKGKSKSKEHRDALAESLYDLDRKCLHRFLEMRSEYPGQEEFFDSNRKALLIAMRDLKSETELRDIRRYIETLTIEEIPQAYLEYQYDSSSVYAHEAAMVDLIDAANFLRKALRTKDKNALLH